MTIKNKLLGVIAISSGGMIVGIAVALVLYAPLETMQRERRTLVGLHSSILKFRSDVLDVMLRPMDEQYERTQRSWSAVTTAFQQTGALDELAGAAENIALSLETVEGLRAAIESDWAEFERKFAALDQDVNALAIPRDDLTVFGLYGDGIERQDIRAWRLVAADAQLLASQTRRLSISLNTVVQVMDGEFQTIDDQLAVVRNRVLRTAAVLILGFLTFSVLLAFFVAGGIGTNIRILAQRLTLLSDGDLSVSVDIRSKDDLSDLGVTMNHFIGHLRSSVRDIKTASNETVEVKDQLLETITQTDHASQEIDSASKSIHRRMEELDSKMEDSRSSVKTVAHHTDSVLEMLQEHSAMVEESTASITEMISSISNVAETAEKKQQATARLVESTDRGSEKLSVTTEIMGEISANVDNVREATEIIQDVAARTSLLAMNAAIEAAHAGEKGVGFAVVAEEIRKLSDTTTESSSRISNFLTEMIGKIHSASQSGQETRAVFEEVHAVVEEVRYSLTEITESMQELNTGGNQILEATTRLQEFSVALKDGGENMGEASQQLDEATSMARTTSSEVLEHITQIGSGIDNVAQFMQCISRLSGRLNDMTSRVNEALSAFDTGESTQDGPAQT